MEGLTETEGPTRIGNHGLPSEFLCDSKNNQYLAFESLVSEVHFPRARILAPRGIDATDRSLNVNMRLPLEKTGGHEPLGNDWSRNWLERNLDKDSGKNWIELRMGHSFTSREASSPIGKVWSPCAVTSNNGTFDFLYLHLKTSMDSIVSTFNTEECLEIAFEF